MSKQKMETRYLPATEVRLLEGDGARTITGYAAVFNSFSEDLGEFKEIIRPGAFTRSLSGGADVRALVDHESGKVLGRTKSGTLRLAEDRRGLRIDCDPPDCSYANDLIASMRRGDIDSMSFGFYTKRDLWRQEGDTMVRELLEVDLFDVSVVTFPAYPATEAALRSLTAWRDENAKPTEPSRLRRARLALAKR